MPTYVPNPDVSRLHFSSQFGLIFKKTWSWILELFQWFVQLLNKLPTGSANVSFLDVMIFIFLIFVVVKFWLGTASGGVRSSASDLGGKNND